MALRRLFVRMAIVSIFMIGIVYLGAVPQATAETLNYKAFVHMTRAQATPIADVEGHVLTIGEREGAVVFENGEWAWYKGVYVHDGIKGLGPLEGYVIYTFLDGSKITTRVKGKSEASPQGFATTSNFTGEIIAGTGRFQGIKGTATISAKLLPPEKGEPGPKAFSEGTVVYTLPGK